MIRHMPLVSAFALAGLLATNAARAEDAPTFADRSSDEFEESDRSFAFMLNPLNAAVGIYGGEADFALGRHVAVTVEGDVYNVNGTLSTALAGGIMWYPLKTTFHGLYVAPRIAFARPLSEGLLQIHPESDALGLGATAGWQWTFDYGFSVRVGGGAMRFFDGSDDRTGLSTTQLVLDGALGWAF